MANELDTNLIAENNATIRKNKRRVFELDAEISTTHAELMLLLTDVEENRALLYRNFNSSFTGNRAIVIDNISDLYSARLTMIDSLQSDSDAEVNFKAMLLNQTKIDQLENKTTLNMNLNNIISEVQHVNVTLQDINTLIADSNQGLVEQVDEMIANNAEWIDGELLKKLRSCNPESNKQGAISNLERLEKLIENSHAAEKEAMAILKRVSVVTKGLLDAGEDISKRRDSIQADRERVVANQRRTAEMITKDID